MSDTTFTETADTTFLGLNQCNHRCRRAPTMGKLPEGEWLVTCACGGVRHPEAETAIKHWNVFNPAKRVPALARREALRRAVAH